MSEKTEEATPKKLRDARKRGEVPRSRDLTSALVLLALVGAGVAWAADAVSRLEVMLRQVLGWIEGGQALGSGQVLRFALGAGARIAGPFLAVAFLCAALVGFLQVGPLLSFEAVMPKLERLDPIKGAKNLVAQKQWVEFAKTLLKFVVVGAVAYSVLRSHLRSVVGLVGQDAQAVIGSVGAILKALFLRVGGVMAAFAIADVFYQRWRFQQDQKMSKDEVKREYKDAEGDPHAKHEREQMHREIVEHDVLEGVRSADVLVVNPEHLAIALRYDEEEHEAPEIVAKGADHLAQKMKDAAREAGVPIMRDVPLARSLFDLELGEEVPEPLFDAVAVVLKAAWKERGEG